MIRFITRVYKRPTRQTIYWALEEVRRAEKQLYTTAYRHVGRESNKVADDMGRRALEAKADVVFWGGKVPEDAPDNQVYAVYEEQNGPAPIDLCGE